MSVPVEPEYNFSAVRAFDDENNSYSLECRVNNATLRSKVFLTQLAFAQVCLLICWLASCLFACLLNIQATCQHISETDLFRQVYVQPHWDRSCTSNLFYCQGIMTLGQPVLALILQKLAPGGQLPEYQFLSQLYNSVKLTS